MLVSLLGTCAAFAAVAITRGRDVVYLSLHARVPVAAFTERPALSLYLGGTREGTAGLAKLDSSFSRALMVQTDTRARFIEDFIVLTPYGPMLGREVEILEGEYAGRRVFVPTRRARPTPLSGKP